MFFEKRFLIWIYLLANLEKRFMLNYIWLALLFLGIATALTTDIIDESSNKFRNGDEISLSVIDYLLKNYADDEAVKKSIDEHVYYIIPRMNPDGAEKMFAGVKTGSKTNTLEYDGYRASPRYIR